MRIYEKVRSLLIVNDSAIGLCKFPRLINTLKASDRCLKIAKLMFMLHSVTLTLTIPRFNVKFARRA